MSEEPLARIEESIRALIRSELGIPAETLTPETRLTDLGTSSVRILRLVAKIEKMYRIELDDDVIFRADTLRQLAALVASCQK